MSLPVGFSITEKIARSREYFQPKWEMLMFTGGKGRKANRRIVKGHRVGSPTEYTLRPLSQKLFSRDTLEVLPHCALERNRMKDRSFLALL